MSVERQAILGVCDSRLALTLRATIFLTSLEHAEAVLRVWKEATEASASCDTRASVSFVQVSSLPRGALVEFQVSALTKRSAMHLQVRAALRVRADVACLARHKFSYFSLSCVSWQANSRYIVVTLPLFLSLLSRACAHERALSPSLTHTVARRRCCSCL